MMLQRPLKPLAKARHVPDGPVQVMPLAQVIGGAPWRVSLLHDRPENVLIWVTRGQGRITVDGVRRGIGTHNAVFLPAGTLFSCDFGPQVLAQFLLCDPDIVSDFSKKPVHLRVRDGLAQAELTSELDAIQRELTQNRPMMINAVAARAALVAVWIQRMSAAGFSDAPTRNAAHRLVSCYARKLVTDFHRGRPMADYARDLNVTPTHLTRVCRSASGLGAADLLTQRRLYAARSLLAEHDRSIKAIAESLGFSSAAYFTRFIRQHTGMAPSTLRDQTLVKRD